MIEYVAKNKYKVTIDIGNVNGKRKRISRISYGTMQKAKLLEAKLIQEKINGTLETRNINKNKESKLNNNQEIIENKKLTFEDLANIFINDYCISNLKENTIYGYKNLLKVVLPKLGHKEADKIIPYDLQLYYNELKKEYSLNTVLHHYVLINNIFVRCKKLGIISSNPNAKIEKPKFKSEEPKIYEYDDLKQLLKVLENEPLKYRVPITLAIDSGMRREELNGLLWDDINLETGEININKARIAVGNEIIVTTPKTAKSKRKIIISDYSLNLLKELKKYQDNMAKTLKNKWLNNENYVFVNDNGLPYYPDTLSKILKKVQIKYNLEQISFHSLRHTSVSLLLNSNEDVASISARVGHSNITTTLNTYSHLIEKSRRETAELMNNILTSV